VEPRGWWRGSASFSFLRRLSTANLSRRAAPISISISLSHILSPFCVGPSGRRRRSRGLAATEEALRDFHRSAHVAALTLSSHPTAPCCCLPSEEPPWAAGRSRDVALLGDAEEEEDDVDEDEDDTGDRRFLAVRSGGPERAAAKADEPDGGGGGWRPAYAAWHALIHCA
jgi:hypothetical protein